MSARRRVPEVRWPLGFHRVLITDAARVPKLVEASDVWKRCERYRFPAGGAVRPQTWSSRF
jgi:hypothetical protein